MVAVVCVPARHDPALDPRVRLAAQARLVPVAQAVVPVAARDLVAQVVVPVVVAPAAMAGAEAEVAHMAAAMATDQRQPHRERRPSPSSRVARSRFRRRLSSRIWRNCSMSRSMR